MALLKFLKGNYSSLNNAAITEGQVLVCKDTAELFVDVDASTRIKIGDYQIVANLDALPEASSVPTTRLYYVEEGNILARSSGSTWIQINKQPTAAELKTALGLGDLAYLSEISEANLSTELAEKVNAASEGNHAHTNKTVLDGITAEKVAAWDGAEAAAKAHADGLDEAMNTRVEALEAIDHTHDNKALLDSYTQTETDLADAVAKKHSHSFNETELNKIVEGDVAKWNGVVADHLTSADKTELSDAIKEAKKAGTDANTNIETYKVANDARVLAVEEDIAEITDGTNGILAQAKNYSDGKLATARGEITAEIDADVKVVADDLAAYKTSNDNVLAGVKATAEAAATKEYADAELAKKVDKITGKSLVDDAQITKLAGVSEGANKVETSETNGNIKIDGVETVVYTHPEKHAITDITGLQTALDGMQAKGDYAAEEHTHTKSEITDFAHTHVAADITDLDATIKGYKYATQDEAKGYADAKDEAIATAQETADDITAYVGTFTPSEGVDTVVKYIDAKTANIASDATVGAISDRVEAIEKDYLKSADKTELSDDIGDVQDALDTYKGTNDAALAEVKATADAAAVKTEVEAALALKADKSVVDAMYTNDKIDELIQGAKDYADNNDADTKYGIVYDSDNKKIKLVEGGTDVEIDASAFIKDGMINTVTIDENDDLIITFNTDAGKENIVLPLDQLVDIYTGVEGTRIKVTVNADKSISADLVEGSISKDYLDADIKASLDLADSAIQSHQDISHLATKDELKTVDDKFASYTTTEDLNKALDLKADKTQVATDIETAKNEAIEAAKTDASNKDAVVLTEAQKGIDAVQIALNTYKDENNEAVALKANAADVYAKTETFTKEEVNAAIAAAVETAQTWGSF